MQAASAGRELAPAQTKNNSAHCILAPTPTKLCTNCSPSHDERPHTITPRISDPTLACHHATYPLQPDKMNAQRPPVHHISPSTRQDECAETTRAPSAPSMMQVKRTHSSQQNGNALTNCTESTNIVTTLINETFNRTYGQHTLHSCA